MKKWWWLWLPAAIFFVNGIWVMTQVDEAAYVTTRDIPHRDILESFGDVLGLWVDEQEFMELDKLDIDCEIEDLRVETETTVRNQQAYNTITLALNMYIDTEASDDYLYMDYLEVRHDVQNALKQSPYEKYIRTLNLNYFRADNSTYLYSDSVGMIGSFKNGATGVKQERKERKAQAIAYDFANELGHKEFDDGTGAKRQYGFAQLTHFGVEKGTTELYVEIEIPSNHKDHTEAFRASMKEHADALQKELKENRTAVKFMKEKTVDSILIVFHVPWDSEMEDYSYKYLLD